MKRSGVQPAKRVRPESYVQDILGPGGLLEQRVPGYKSRPEQLALAEYYAGYLFSVASPKIGLDPSERARGSFLSEAPCGTGKTFAYLVPLLYTTFSKGNPGIASKSVRITTAGISLQEQLVGKDIPLLLDVMSDLLEEGIVVQLCKGISNYVCKKKLQVLHNKPDRVRLELYGWASSTTDGDLSNAPMVPTPQELEQLAVSSEECLDAKCPEFARCFGKAPKNMLRTCRFTVQVMNHHYFAQSSRNYQTFANTVVDEAHELPLIWSEQYITRISSSALDRVLRVMGQPGLSNPIQTFGPLFFQGSKPYAAPSIKEARTFLDALQAVHGKLNEVRMERRKNQDEAELSLTEFERNKLDTFLDRLGQVSYPERSSSRPLLHRIDDAQGRLKEYEVLLLTPPSKMERAAFFSATLKDHTGYDSYIKEMCTDNRDHWTYTAKSPFDWGSQALVVLPTMPYASLNSAAFHRYLAETVAQVAAHSKGRMLVACTSWGAVHASADQLRKGPYQVLVQGEMPKKALIDRFKEDTHSILVGTLSLWTGVDVPGEALSALVIDKLPFPSQLPPHVALKELLGESVFMEHSVPHATKLLAQGFGRLIRSVNDKGVCVLLDPRISPRSPAKKPYAAMIWNAAIPPECNLSFDLSDISRFLATRSPLPYSKSRGMRRSAFFSSRGRLRHGLRSPGGASPRLPPADPDPRPPYHGARDPRADRGALR